MRRVALLAAAIALAGCASNRRATQIRAEAQVGPGGLTVSQIQSEVMSCADNMVSLISQGADHTRGLMATARGRADAQAQKVRTGIGIYTIAAEPNPITSVMDLAILGTLSRWSQEKYWLPEIYGEAGRPLLESCVEAEASAWRLVDLISSEQQISELRDLIEQWQSEHPKQVYVSHIRFEDFAAFRRTRVAGKQEGRGSLLGLVGLDPLANLDPTTREIEQSRLLGERMFFYATRAGKILRWQAELVTLELAASPESQQVLGNLERLTNVVEEYPEQTRALMNEFFTELRHENAGLDTTLGELHTTLDAADRLVASVNELAAKFEREESSEPLDLAKVQGTIEQTTVAADGLNQLVQSVDRLLASSEGDRRLKDLEDALALAEAGFQRQVTRVFLMLGGLVVLIFAGILLNTRLRR